MHNDFYAQCIHLIFAMMLKAKSMIWTKTADTMSENVDYYVTQNKPALQALPLQDCC